MTLLESMAVAQHGKQINIYKWEYGTPSMLGNGTKII